jgi:hypothetical protein
MASMSRRPATTGSITPRSYVVRVYRRTTAGLVGQVQDVLTGNVRVFRTLSGLWRALGGVARPASTRNNAAKE